MRVPARSVMPSRPALAATPAPVPTPAPTPVQKPLPPAPTKVARPQPEPRVPKAPPVSKPEFSFVPPKTDMPAGPKRKARGSKKKVWAVVAVLVLLIAGAAGYYYLYYRNHHKPQTTAAPVKKAETVQKTDAATGPPSLIRIIGVGDSIAYTSINNAAKQSDGSYNYLPMMQSLKPTMTKADIRFCSQATPAGGAGLGISGTPVFNAPTEFAKGLSEVGCNAVSLASDHMNDKDQTGIVATRTAWDALKPLGIAGTNVSAEEQAKAQYFTVKGAKFALLAYTTSSAKASSNPASLNMYSEELAKAQIERVRKDADFIIVSMHWGEDGQADQNAQQDGVAQFLAAQNVDIIFGHGPHVVQPVKVLSGQGNHQTLVWFSLGNFLNSQVPVESLVGGVAVMDVNPANGQILNPRFLPTYMHYEWTAQQKARQSADDVLARTNFQLVTLDQATDLLPKSQNNTTIKAQQDRLSGILNKYLKVPLITTAEY